MRSISAYTVVAVMESLGLVRRCLRDPAPISAYRPPLKGATSGEMSLEILKLSQTLTSKNLHWEASPWEHERRTREAQIYPENTSRPGALPKKPPINQHPPGVS